MLLVIDVGNTNTVIGLFAGDKLAHRFRLQTIPGRTADEFGVLLADLFQHSLDCPWKPNMESI